MFSVSPIIPFQVQVTSLGILVLLVFSVFVVVVVALILRLWLCLCWLVRPSLVNFRGAHCAVLRRARMVVMVVVMLGGVEVV